MSIENEVILKANTLIEALPYIRQFNGTKIVVKYGGSAMLDEQLKYEVMKDVALLKLVGMKPIIVHGGGKEISKWMQFIGKESEFVNGLRVTDKDTVEVAEMVLNKVNKSLVGMMEKQGIKAVGLSGRDGGMLRVEKKVLEGQDLGFVGNVKEVNADLLESLIEDDYVPVIAPIGFDDEFEVYNINADDVASAIAKGVHAEKLVFLTDIEGVYMEPKDKNTLISEMNLKLAKQMVANGIVGGGMIPKLRNCIEAIESGVGRVHIVDGRQKHCLLLEFFTEKGIGTVLVK